MGYAISRYWRQNPFWFDGLKKEEKLLLIADYNLSNQDPKKQKRHDRDRMIERIKERRKELKSQGAKNGYKNK